MLSGRSPAGRVGDAERCRPVPGFALVGEPPSEAPGHKPGAFLRLLFGGTMNSL